VHLKGVDSMVISGFKFGNTLVGIGWAVSVLLCTNGLKKNTPLTLLDPMGMGSLMHARLKVTSTCRKIIQPVMG